MKRVKDHIGQILEELIAEYSDGNRGMEIRQIAGGYRMGTKPEHHDVVVNFRQEFETADSTFPAGAGNAGRHCLQAARDRA